MAQGLEVLQAALAGKRVRFLSHINGQWGTWKDLAGLQNWGIHRLFDHEWEIEDSTLTFTEAVAAMDAGQLVEHGECLFRKRAGAHVYEYKAYDDLGWAEAEFDFQDIHATDWRIVPQPTDERPTREDVAECIRDSWLINAPETEIQAALNVMEVRWPAMFREDGQ